MVKYTTNSDNETDVIVGHDHLPVRAANYQCQTLRIEILTINRDSPLNVLSKLLEKTFYNRHDSYPFDTFVFFCDRNGQRISDIDIGWQTYPNRDMALMGHKRLIEKFENMQYEIIPTHIFYKIRCMNSLTQGDLK